MFVYSNIVFRYDENKYNIHFSNSWCYLVQMNLIISMLQTSLIEKSIRVSQILQLKNKYRRSYLIKIRL